MCDDCGQILEDGDTTVTIAQGFLCGPCADVEERDENVGYLGHFISGEGSLWA